MSHLQTQLVEDQQIESQKIKKYKPHWFTYEAVQDVTTRWIGFTGGVGSGKTDGASLWHWVRTRQNHESPFSWIVSPTYGKLWDSIIPRYKNMLESFGYLRGVHYQIKQSPLLQLEFLYSGHCVHFHGADRPDLMVAVEISHVLIEEPGRMKRQVFTEIDERLRCSRATINQGLMSGVPQGINAYAEMFDF